MCLFFFVDPQMGSPQWSDLGMFLQTFMLLAKEAGLDTCAQEAWSLKNDSVSEFVNSDAGDILFCGMSIGFKDESEPINSLRSERRPLEEWAKFYSSYLYIINMTIEHFMSQAMILAKRAFAYNEVPVGAIIVKDNKIIGSGFNQVIKKKFSVCSCRNHCHQ